MNSYNVGPQIHMVVKTIDSINYARHCYTNFTGGGRFRFPAAGKAVRRGLEATVNRGLTAAGGFARRG